MEKYSSAYLLHSAVSGNYFLERFYAGKEVRKQEGFCYFILCQTVRERHKKRRYFAKTQKYRWYYSLNIIV